MVRHCSNMSREQYKWPPRANAAAMRRMQHEPATVAAAGN